MQTNLELLPLDQTRYQGINNTAFKLLCRIAFLANGTTAPITYGTNVVMAEFDFTDRSARRNFVQLEQAGYISRSNSGGRSLQQSVALTFDAVLANPTNTAQSSAMARPNTSLYEHLANCGYGLPKFMLRPNKPYQTYENEPLLESLRSNMWQIDLSELMASSKLDLRPFGKRHSWKFDFEPLKQWLKPINAQMDDIITMYPDFTGFCWRNKHFMPFLKEFFIMSMAIELTVGLHDCFIRQDEFDPFGSNFLDLWYQYQRGPLFACLEGCYQTESGTIPLAKRICNTFSPAEGFILDYAFVCIRNELVKLLNNEVAANRCFNSFCARFYDYSRKQSYINSSTSYMQVDPLWLETVWGPNLDKGLLSYEEPYFIPRISWPLIQFRTLVGMNRIAKLNECIDEWSCNKATAVLIRSYMREPYKSELLKLSADMAPYFPFFNQVPNYLASLQAMEP